MFKLDLEKTEEPEIKLPTSAGSREKMEYYSAVKKNTFESVLMRWMKLEPIIQNEVSQKEKHQYSISSIKFSSSVVSYSLPPYESQYTRPSYPSPTPRVH